jgi:hypothetical protein
MWEGPLRPDNELSANDESGLKGPSHIGSIYFAGFSGGSACCQSTTSFHIPTASVCQI